MVHLLQKIHQRHTATKRFQIVESVLSYQIEVFSALRAAVAIHDHHDCVALIEGRMEKFMHVEVEECWVGFDELLRMFAL